MRNVVHEVQLRIVVICQAKCTCYGIAYWARKPYLRNSRVDRHVKASCFDCWSYCTLQRITDDERF